ncbi:MAG: hypothetical protein NC043_05065 [Muribaculaceae bacterium]|nr:hypothetical protein [Muribaculaceae bacterium]
MKPSSTHFMNSPASIAALITMVCCLAISRAADGRHPSRLSAAGFTAIIIGGTALVAWLIWGTYVMATHRSLSPMRPVPLRTVCTIGMCIILATVFILPYISTAWVIPIISLMWIICLIIILRSR